MAEPLWRDLLVAAFGPLVAAIIGGLAVGLFVSSRNRKAEERRRTAFRAELVAEMARLANSFELAIAVYRRQSKGVRRRAAARLAEKLDDAYVRTRSDAAAMQLRLEVHYDEGDGDPSVPWHAVVDCFTVLYFDALGRSTDDLRRANAASNGVKHSGLSASELSNVETVRRQFKVMLKKATLAAEQSNLRSLA